VKKIDHGFVANVRKGFETTYIDPYQLAKYNASRIVKNMEEYLEDRRRYVAPCTCLVTGSMMGKSRLIKEMTGMVPAIFVCARETSAFGGFPPATPEIMEWFQKGALSVTPDKNELKRDATGENAISTLQYSLFFVSTFRTLADYLTRPDFLKKYEVETYASHNDYSWTWNFFADIKDKGGEHEGEIAQFWREVVTDVMAEGRDHFTIGAAIEYYKHKYQPAATLAYAALKSSLSTVGYNIDNDFTLLLVFDEARQFCQLAAEDGAILRDDADIFRHSKPSSESNANSKDTISGFRALKRAMRLLCFGNPVTAIRTFGLFTDTTSRITNFQPLPGEDRSLRELQVELGTAGKEHFKPLIYFTTIDAYSRLYNTCASVENVADPERLVNFGRAGWRDMFIIHTRRSLNLAAETAGIKLINAVGRDTAEKSWAPYPTSHAEFIKLLAVLAPRICLTAGAYSLQANELVASHMAVLLKTDDQRHYLRMFYPSEPLLAEGAARLLLSYGWSQSLRVLEHYIQAGVVDAGFRGELLTKIVCLMAMDEVHIMTKSIFAAEFFFRFSRPVPVSDFLNHLISLDGIANKPENCSAKTVAEYILANHHPEIDHAKVDRFLSSGYVFFSHFTRVLDTLDIATVVQNFNRGAAIMCKPCNPDFDHFIPVVFKDAATAQFGPLDGPWNEEQIKHGRAGVSGIFIDSKNYGSTRNWVSYAQRVVPATKGGAKNFADEWGDNVFLSIVQDFGTGKGKHVELGPTTSHEMKLRSRKRSQIQLVMRGISGKTYECLNGSKEKPFRPKEMEGRIRYLSALAHAKADFLDFEWITDDGEKKVKIQRAVRDLISITVPADSDRYAEWTKERKRIAELTDGRKRRLEEDDLESERPQKKVRL
jgi:hypothetical protein